MEKDEPVKSAIYHFDKYGEELNSGTLQRYVNQAEAFSQNLRGTRTSPVRGYIEGVIRYSKNGRYIDLAPDGRIISFGSK